jgi:hypothetical protein
MESPQGQLRVRCSFPGDELSIRYWFFASLGQQQGPYPEAQFREFIADGKVRSDTLVWTGGMANWQRAGEIPGLIAASAAPTVSGGMPASSEGTSVGSLSIDFGIWDFTWRSLVFLLGAIFVIPLPDGKPLGLSFSGSYWGYLGWNLLAALSLITIIGWAWVYTAQMRWVCRNIEGTRREVIFKATGLQYLWRAIVAVLACSLIIPIPWALRWIIRWHASQIVLAERISHQAT